MKEKIILFIIGVLIGAVISTGAFYVYTTTANSCNNGGQSMEMNGGTPPAKPDGDNSQPPEMPNENNT